MKRPHRPKLACIAAGSTAALGLFATPYLSAHEHEKAARAIGEMTDAARAFITSLDDGKRGKAVFAWDDEERENWHYVPIARKGLSMNEMRADQRALAFGLLGSGMSQRGLVQASTIMSLEQILAELENDPERRDPGKYFVSIFGSPEAGATWGWRVEGHHLSINFTIVKGSFVAGTPSFMGTNPGEVREGPRKGIRPLGIEEDLGRELVLSLLKSGKKAVVVASDAYAEILTREERKVSPLADEGVLAGEMTDGQRQILVSVIKEYLGRNRAEFAAADLAAIEKAGIGKIRFAWAGSTDFGKAHYYRVQGPTFLLEYANTQNNANHAHATWRAFDGDFGRDLLAEHYKSAHAK